MHLGRQSGLITAMKPMWFRPGTILTAGLLLPLVATGLRAEYNPFRTDTHGDALRAGRFETYLVGQYWSAGDSTLHGVTLPTTPPPDQVFETGDLTMQFDDAFVWGFGLGYNLNSHFTVRGEFSFGEPDYAITFNNLEGRGEAFMHAGKFNLDYNIVRGPLTPFATAGIGYLIIDSGIPSGPTEFWCWYDYWWGYVCEGSTPTYTETWFTGNAAAGVRWDVNELFFMKASIGILSIRTATRSVPIGPSATKRTPVVETLASKVSSEITGVSADND